MMNNASFGDARCMMKCRRGAMVYLTGKVYAGRLGELLYSHALMECSVWLLLMDMLAVVCMKLGGGLVRQKWGGSMQRSRRLTGCGSPRLIDGLMHRIIVTLNSDLGGTLGSCECGDLRAKRSIWGKGSAQPMPAEDIVRIGNRQVLCDPGGAAGFSGEPSEQHATGRTTPTLWKNIVTVGTPSCFVDLNMKYFESMILDGLKVAICLDEFVKMSNLGVPRLWRQEQFGKSAVGKVTWAKNGSRNEAAERGK